MRYLRIPTQKSDSTQLRYESLAIFKRSKFTLLFFSISYSIFFLLNAIPYHYTSQHIFVDWPLEINTIDWIVSFMLSSLLLKIKLSFGSNSAYQNQIIIDPIKFHTFWQLKEHSVGLAIDFSFCTICYCFYFIHWSIAAAMKTIENILKKIIQQNSFQEPIYTFAHEKRWIFGQIEKNHGELHVRRW